VMNIYGPTEDTIYSTWGQMKAGEQPTIGLPLAEKQSYVLDRNMKLVPIGVSGELYLGGVGLARGYFGRGDLTAERFVPNPYSEIGGERLYRTGDVVRRRVGGEIEYLGRIDQQVKVRGFRIELGEIEAALKAHGSIRDCVVVAQDDETGKRIVAYLVWAPDEEEKSNTELRQYLKERLPEYMVPAVFVGLEQLPLTTSGKVDRKALPAPSITSPAESYAGPRSEIESLLVGIWSEVLKVSTIGIHDNFFELGGHSLLATQVISRLHEVLGLNLQVRQIFETPTIAELAARLSQLQSGASMAPVLMRAERNGRAPASYAQERLWFIDLLERNSSAYNVPLAVRLHGELDRRALEQSFDRLIHRHEILRTTFALEGEILNQVVGEISSVAIRFDDLTALPEQQRDAEARLLATLEAREPFDLATGPLMRVSLLRLAAEDHVLLVTMHHIISDGWSMGIFMQELSACYNSFAAGREPELRELPLQYADYAIWQREWLQGSVLNEQLEYWREHLTGAPALLELPADRPRPTAPTHHGTTKMFMLPKEVSQGLRILSRTEDVTLFMMLLAGWQMLLSYYSGENDIVIGTNVANRNRSDLEGLIGFFINQLAIRTSLSANPTFRELLVRVREATLSAYAHQELPFEKVVEALNPKREPGYSPLFQVKINLVNTPEDTVSFGNLELRHFRVRQEGSHFDLTLSMEETGSGVLAAVQYSTDLFNEQTIVDMMADYEFLLTSVVADPDVKVETLRSVIKQRRDERHQTRIGEYKAEQKRKLTNLKRRFLEPPRPELGGDYDEHRI
jgi:hypothetical protein